MSGTLRSNTRPRLRWSALAAAVVLTAVSAPFVASPASGAPTDITAEVLAGRDVRLDGDAVVNLPAGETTYGGLISGEGTFTVRGSGRLILTEDSDFTLPRAHQRQRVETGTSGDSYAVTTVHDPDPPAIVVEKGATLQYGPGEGAKGVIGHSPYETPGFQLNALNIKVDGTLDVAVHRKINLGVISGSGFIIQRRFTWDGIWLAGDHPFSGTLYNGTGMDLGSPYFKLSIPNVRKILNQGSAIVGAPTGHRHVLTQDFYSREWGNDINFNFPLSQRAMVVVTGVYSWADSGPDHDPSLSDPSLNFATVPHNNNKRGVNIEGSHVQWGDGTHNRFFLPGNANTVYINLHEHRGNRGRLAFDYNGPVTLHAPISGGIYHDTLAAPGLGDVVIIGTPGNDVTFAAVQNYDGATVIEENATLRIGTGEAGSDGGLLTGTPHYEIRNEGALIIQNVERDVELSRVGGGGSLEQAGPATTTLAGDTTYTGATVISAGTLAVTAGDISRSRGVTLTSPGAILDLTRAGDQRIKRLSGVSGTTVEVGSHTVTVGTRKATTFAGALVGDGGGLIKVGAGALTMAGASTTPGGAWRIEEGELRLGDAEHEDASIRAAVTVVDEAALSGAGRIDGPVTTTGTVATDGLLEVTGDYVQTGGLLRVAEDGRLRVGGTVTLSGTLEVSGDALPADTDQVIVIDNIGTEPVTGAFDGLPEGATLTVAGAEYELSYAGGDGNDVVLTSAAVAAGASQLSAGLDAPPGLRWWTAGPASVLALLALAGAVVLVLVIRRRRAGRHRRVGREPSKEPGHVWWRWGSDGGARAGTLGRGRPGGR